MAEIINLNQFRKRRALQDRRSQAAGNRVRHGRSKDSRAHEAHERDSEARHLDDKQLDRDGGPEGESA